MTANRASELTRSEVCLHLAFELGWNAFARNHFQVHRRAGPRQRPGDPPDTDRRSRPAIRRGGLPPALRRQGRGTVTREEKTHWSLTGSAS